MRKLLSFLIAILFFTTICFAAGVNLKEDFYNRNTAPVTGTVEWFLKSYNNNIIDVTYYCAEGDGARAITIPAKNKDGTLGTASLTCSVPDVSFLKDITYTYYANITYTDPLNGLSYTVPTKESKTISFQNIAPSLLDSVRKFIDSVLGMRTCDKNPNACQEGYFCYLTDNSTAELNTLEKMKAYLNKSSDNRFGYINPEQLEKGCLASSSKELFQKMGIKSSDEIEYANKLMQQPVRIRFETEDSEALLFKNVAANVTIWKTNWDKNPGNGNVLVDTKTSPFEYDENPDDSISYLEITADGYLGCKIDFVISYYILNCGESHRDKCNTPKWAVSTYLLGGDCIVDENSVVVSNMVDAPIKQGFDETGVVKIKLKRDERLTVQGAELSECGGKCNTGRCSNYEICMLNEDNKELECTETDICKYLKADLSYSLDTNKEFKVSAKVSNNPGYRGQVCNQETLLAAFVVADESGKLINSMEGNEPTVFSMDYKSVTSGKTLSYTSLDTWNLTELCKGRDNFTYALFTGCGVRPSDGPGENLFRKLFSVQQVLP